MNGRSQRKSPCPQGGKTDKLLETQTNIPKSLLPMNSPSIGLTLDESDVLDARPLASHKLSKVAPLDGTVGVAGEIRVTMVGGAFMRSGQE
ncbi:hypothetical protein Tco_0961961, partial [Tanacetum coccineum]